jgi:PIN domain nuclease of toxin-antitoxin system
LIVLDTHVLLWWLDEREGALSPSALRAIDETTTVAVSAWSCWEIATLARLGRIFLDRPVQQWLDHARAGAGYAVIPVSAEIAAMAGSISGKFPGDPADRTVYATAIASAGRLVTRDTAIRKFDPLRTIW